MSKRILSLALVVMMLAAFIPATLFTASAEGETSYQFKYSFIKDATCDRTDLGFTRTKGTDTNYFKTASIVDYSMTHGFWKFHSENGHATSGDYYGIGAGDTINLFGAGSDCYIAYDLNVPVSGTFDVTITSGAAASRKADYFLLPAGTDLSDPTSISTSTPGAILLFDDYKAKSATRTGVTVNAGEYILFIIAESSSGNGNIRFKEIEFKTSGGTDFVSPFVGTIDPVKVSATATVAATARVYDAYTGDAITEGIGLSTESSAIATASGLNVTGVAAGTTKLYATVSGREGRTIPLDVTVEGPGYQFRYTFNKEAVYDRTDLGFSRAKASDGGYYQTKSIVDYSMTHGAWKFNSKFADSGQDHSNGKYYGIGATETIHFFGAGTGRHLAYDINVPVSGVFDVTIESISVGTATADYYLLPAGTDISNPASISTSTPGAILLVDNYTTSPAVKENVAVNKGEYILFIKVEDSAPAGKNVRHKYITFTSSGKETFNTPYIGTVDPVSVTEGDTADVAAEAHIYDAYTGEAIASGISFSTASSAIATASGTTVTGVAGGTTKLNAAVSGREGNVIPGNLTVIPKGYKFKYSFLKSAAHDIPELGLFNKINPQGKSNAYLESAITDYAMTHGAWKFNSQNGYTNQDYGLLDAQFIFSFSAGSGRYLALDINVPASGTYDVTLTHNAATIAADYFILPKGTSLSDVSAIADGVNGAQAIATNYAGTSKTKSGITLEKGEYIFLTRVPQNLAATKSIHYKSLEFATTGATLFNDAYFGTVDPVVVDEGYDATANARIYNAYTDAAYTGDVTFATENAGIATVSGKTVTGVADGETKLNASIAGKANIIPGKVTVTNPGYKFKYGFDRTTYTIDVPELGLYRELNQDGKTCYHIRSITDYAMAKGAWKFNSDNGFTNYGYGLAESYLIHSFVNSKAGRYLAIDLNVPVAGTYDVSVTNGSTSPKADYFLVPAGTDLSDIATIENAEGAKTLFTEYSGTANAKTATGIALTKGTHTLVIRIDDAAAGKEVTNLYLKSVELVTTGATVYVPAYFGTADSAYVVEGATKSANARIYDTYSYAAYTGDVTFAISGDAASLSGKTITGAEEGYATISATIDAPARIISGKVTVGNADMHAAFDATKIEDEFNKQAPTAYAYIKGGDVAELEIGVVENGNNYTLTAPEEEGYTFLYWANGLTTIKKILGFEAELSYKPQNGSNIVIAVYEKEGEAQATKAEFYSGNGQLVETLEEDGVAPELPDMPGYTATVWMNVARDELGEGDAVTLEEGVTEIWVAQYEEADGVTVTAVNATGGATVAYGELVTLEANIPEGKTFRYWTKKSGNGDAEIVGFKSKTYSFYAWEDCTVEAVYGDAAPIYSGSAMKILVDTFGNNSVMAEFIGFGGVTILEKGISLDGTDFAMTSDMMQFSLSDIGSADATGYAIIKSGETVYRIEDGE